MATSEELESVSLFVEVVVVIGRGVLVRIPVEHELPLVHVPHSTLPLPSKAQVSLLKQKKKAS